MKTAPFKRASTLLARANGQGTRKADQAYRAWSKRVTPITQGSAIDAIGAMTRHGFVAPQADHAGQVDPLDPLRFQPGQLALKDIQRNRVRMANNHG